MTSRRCSRPSSCESARRARAIQASAKTSSTSRDRLTLADQAGPFGNPTSDSARTMVTEATSAVLTVVFAPAETSPARLASVLEATAGRLIQFAGGRQTLRAVI